MKQGAPLARKKPMARGTSTLRQKAPLKAKSPIARKVPDGEAKPVKGPKPKKCANRACRAPYIPDPKQPFKNWCDDQDCAVVIALEKLAKQKAAKAKVERAKDRAKKESLKGRADWVREAQQALNAYVRQRDAHLPCISCGRWHDGQWHAGHFLSVGARPGLRFVESNLAKQCMPCNVHLSGNLLNFRLGLIARIGAEAVSQLECDDAPRKHTIEELKAIRDHYRAKLKALKAKSNSP